MTSRSILMMIPSAFHGWERGKSSWLSWLFLQHTKCIFQRTAVTIKIIMSVFSRMYSISLENRQVNLLCCVTAPSRGQRPPCPWCKMFCISINLTNQAWSISVPVLEFSVHCPPFFYNSTSHSWLNIAFTPNLFSQQVNMRNMKQSSYPLVQSSSPSHTK